jgi:hypothetical protein
MPFVRGGSGVCRCVGLRLSFLSNSVPLRQEEGSCEDASPFPRLLSFLFLEYSVWPNAVSSRIAEWETEGEAISPQAGFDRFIVHDTCRVV